MVVLVPVLVPVTVAVAIIVLLVVPTRPDHLVRLSGLPVDVASDAALTGTGHPVLSHCAQPIRRRRVAFSLNEHFVRARFKVYKDR